MDALQNEIQQLEKELTYTKESFELVLEATPIVVFKQDLDLRYTWIYNTHAGFTEEMVLGKTDAELLPPEDSSYLMDIKRRVIESGVSCREIVRTTINGVAFYYDLYIKPIHGSSGSIKGIACASMDINESHRSGEQIEELSRRITFQDLLLNKVNNAVIVTDMDGIVVYWNKYAEHLYQWKFDEVIGKNILNINVPRDNIWHGAQIIKEIEYTNLWEGEFIVQRKDESNFIAQVNNSVIVNANGKPEFIVGISTDITPRKQLELEMCRLDRLNLLGETAAGIAHEIRNPMTTVRGLLQLLKSKERYAQDQTYLDLMINELDRANSIISKFLSINPSKEIVLKKLNINQIVEDIFPLIQADAMYCNSNFIIELSDTLDLLLDETEIRQVILNLVRNGLEAMPPNKTLTVRTYMENNEVILAVQDEGSGIKPDIMGKLGIPFFTTKDSGTGLGLTTCYSIAARYNATINFETSPSGTTFFVKFKISANKLKINEYSAELSMK